MRTHEVYLIVHVHVDDMIVVTRLEPEIRENGENGHSRLLMFED